MKKAFMLGAFIVLFSSFALGGARCFFMDSHQMDEKSQPSSKKEVTDIVSEHSQIPVVQDVQESRSLDWQQEFGDINWQKSVYAICDKDFTILRYGSSSDRLSCESGTRGNVPLRHITEQEKKLANFIEQVVKMVASNDYVLGGVHGDSRDVWVEDLNNDGKVDMAIFLTPASEMDAESRYSFSKDTSRNILFIVTPTSLDGASRKMAELSEKDLEKIAPPSYTTFQFEKSIDFDRDGKKELLIPGYLNKPASSVFKIDYDKGTITQVQLCDGGEPVYIGYGASALERLAEFYLKDEDRDGVDEFIEERLENNKVTLRTVHKWNGSCFN